MKTGALSVRRQWAADEPHLPGRLMRPVSKNGPWLAEPQRTFAAAALIDRAPSGYLTISQTGGQRRVDPVIGFDLGAASLRCRSRAKWLATRTELDPRSASRAAGAVVRSRAVVE